MGGAAFVVWVGACVLPPPQQQGATTPTATPDPEPAPSYGNRYKVTVVAASITGTRPDGRPWHMKAPDKGGMMLLGALVGASFGGLAGAQLGSSIGGEMAGDSKAHPPSPRAEMRIGGTLFETFPLPATAAPRWDYGFAIDVRDFGATTPVVLAVRDVDGGEILGEKTMTLADLLASPSRNDPMGSVTSFQVSVEALPDRPEPKTLSFQVPMNVSIETNAKEVQNRPRFQGDWQGVPLLNGDVVRIQASGRGCPSNWFSDRCSGPEGFTQYKNWMQHNRTEFKDLPHASLVAMLAGKPFFVGGTAQFTVERPGVLLLGVNDKDTGNNKGEFAVVVEVNPPDLVRQRPSTPGYQPPAWQSPPPPQPAPEPAPQPAPQPEQPSAPPSL
jgi:hypothetical protein